MSENGVLQSKFLKVIFGKQCAEPTLDTDTRPCYNLSLELFMSAYTWLRSLTKTTPIFLHMRTNMSFMCLP